MTEQWPPEWDDPEPDDGHQDVELPELTAFLASVPSPALPASFEARISAAIAAEAVARAATVPDPAAEHDRAPEPDQAPEPTPSRTGVQAHSVTSAHRRPRLRRPRMPSAQASSWVVVCCLILAGFGFLVSHGSSSSSSSEASPASESAPQAASSAAAGSAAGPDHAFADEPSAGSSSTSNGFLVYSTGTAYDRSSLVSQVQGQLNFYGGDTSGSTSGTATAPVPADSASASAAASSVAGSEPSPKLAGCVSAVTDGVSATLVDKATYDGTPAYIIAAPTEVWVVGLGCTADHTELITRVALKG